MTEEYISIDSKLITLTIREDGGFPYLPSDFSRASMLVKEFTEFLINEARRETSFNIFSSDLGYIDA